MAAVWERTMLCVANKAMNVIEIFLVKFNCRQKIGVGVGPPVCEKALPLRDVAPKAHSAVRSAGDCRAFYERRVVRRVGRTPYECSAGGACAKMCASRKTGLTHVDVSSALGAKRASNCGGLITGGWAPCSQLPDAISVIAHTWSLRCASA